MRSPVSGARNYIARLDAATGAADSFNANSFVYSIAVKSDGKILAGGGFTNIRGQTRSRFGPTLERHRRVLEADRYAINRYLDARRRSSRAISAEQSNR